MSAAELLSIEELSVSLPSGGDRAFAVRGVSFTIKPGECLCVIGESGSGKSVTAHSVLGLLDTQTLRPSGRIMFEGRDLLALPAGDMRRLRGSKLAMVFQEPMSALNPVHTVGRQIGEMIKSHQPLGRRAIEQRVVEALAAVGLPEPEIAQHAFPHRLSGGQRQRVMIAMALANNPALLVADEPTTALDVTTQAQILKLIREMRARSGTAVMLITHDFGVVAEMADRIVVMRHGEVVETGTTEEVLQHPQHPYTRELIGAVPRLPSRHREEPAVQGKAILEIRDARLTFRRDAGLFRRSRKVNALDGVNLVLRRGETLGVVGESGSGKSTLARCVVRLLNIQGGRIEFRGTDLMSLQGAALQPFRRRIQMVFQDPYSSLNPRRTIEESVGAPLAMQGVTGKDMQRRIAEILELVGLNAAAMKRYPHEFSGGQRQRIGIARALIVEPELLVADEPVSSLDVSIQQQVLRLLASVREKMSLSMLFITHDLRVAAQICDTVAVMRKGVVVEFGAIEKVFSSPSHPYTQSLLEAVPGRGWFAEGSA